MGVVFFCEEYVVVLAGIERRVEIDQIDGLVLDEPLKNVVVVAVIEMVFPVGRGLGLRLPHRFAADPSSTKGTNA